MEICPFCGEVAYCSVGEVWQESRELELDACCEANLEGWIESIHFWSRRERARWMYEETGLIVKDLLMSGGVLNWIVDYGLKLGPVSFADAREFVERHHRHSKAPAGWKFGQAVFNGRDMVGVMMAGRPVSAALQAQGCLEINRVCVLDTRPRALIENACSMLYGYACRIAFRSGYSRVVTYTKMDELGTSLRAAGFVPVAVSQGGSWHRRRRPRIDSDNIGPKVRWERWLDGARLPVQELFVFAPDIAPRAVA